MSKYDYWYTYSPHKTNWWLVTPHPMKRSAPDATNLFVGLFKSSWVDNIFTQFPYQLIDSILMSYKISKFNAATLKQSATSKTCTFCVGTLPKNNIFIAYWLLSHLSPVRLAQTSRKWYDITFKCYVSQRWFFRLMFYITSIENKLMYFF